MTRGINVSCVMTCLLRKQAGLPCPALPCPDRARHNEFIFGMDWTINQIKKHYLIGALSVERPMLPK